MESIGHCYQFAVRSTGVPVSLAEKEKSVQWILWYVSYFIFGLYSFPLSYLHISYSCPASHELPLPSTCTANCLSDTYSNNLQCNHLDVDYFDFWQFLGLCVDFSSFSPLLFICSLIVLVSLIFSL